MRGRYWLLFLSLFLTIGGYAQTLNGLEDPYKDKPGRHLSNQRPRAIPPQNYRRPTIQPGSGNYRFPKNGLNTGRSQTQAQRRKTRGPRQDRNLTQASTNEITPIYAPGATKMYLASNATAIVNGKFSTPGAAFHIWRGDLDDGNSDSLTALLTNLTRITGDIPEEQNGDQIEPALNTVGNLLAYASRPNPGIGSYNIVVRNLTTGQRIQLTTDNNNIVQNRRPTLSPGGNLVAFSSNRQHDPNLPRDGRFRIFMTRADGRPFDDGQFYRVMSTPGDGENDLEPAWSPNGREIAYARTRGDGTSHVYLVDINTRAETQWTTFAGAHDRQPAWEPDGGTIVFATKRKSIVDGQHTAGAVATENGTIFDVYRYDGDLPENGSQAIAITVDTSTTANTGTQFPTSAIRVILNGEQQRQRVAYQSTRPTPDAIRSIPPGPNDIFETATVDQDAPVLEIIPEVYPKEVFPGDTVRVKAKVTDFQSGVSSVRVQFKDPDSAEQDEEGLEHKLYLLIDAGTAPPNWFLADQAPAYVPLFVEIGQQAIHPTTYQHVDPYVLLPFGFPGSLDDTLALSAVPVEEQGEPDWYQVTWRTPEAVASDFYIDIIVQDNSGNEYIYDNITGFTSKRFVGANPILLVNDYMAGQMFVQTRGDAVGGFGVRPTWAPVESYWTDNPTAKPPFDLTQPPTGTPLTIIGDGAIVGPAFTIRADTLGENTTYNDRYDLWRVQCRNPITPSALAGYLPRFEQEPINLQGGFRDKLVSERVLMWGSPYTGNIWAGPGHLLDPEVQVLLRNFLNGGGRMVVSGQDVAWALALRGGVSNDFLTQALRATFDSDASDDVIIGPYLGNRHQLTAVPAPAGEDPNPIANNPAGIGIWVRLEGGAFVRDEPADFRLAHPHAVQLDSAGNLLTFARVFPPGTTATTPTYSDAAWNQLWPDTVTVDPTDRAPYRYNARGAGPGTSDRAGFYYANATNRSRVAFFSFGMEGVNTHYNDTGIPGFLWARSYRNKILHNAFAWMTTGVVQGNVQAYDPDTRTYQPLERAFVTITGLAPASLAGVEAGYAITDSSGFYRIAGLEPGAYLVSAERPGFVTQHEEFVVVVGGVNIINLVMLKTPPGQITGKVMDINNQPVRAALVRATNQDDPTLTVEILSDPDGTYLLPRVPVGDWSVTVTTVSQGGYTLPPVQPTPDGVFRNVQVTSGQTVALEDFVLAPVPGTLKGRVSDVENNSALVNAQVTVLSGTNVIGTASTDASGEYSLSVPAGTYTVTAAFPGYATGTASVVVISDEEVTQNFELAKLPPGTITGRVVRKIDSQPEPGVTVSLIFNTQTQATVQTDSNGNYTFANVPVGTYTVTAAKSGTTITPTAGYTVTIDPNETETLSNFLSEPLRTFVQGTTLVSAPYTYTKTMAELLSIPSNELNPTDFRFFTWITNQGLYQFYPNAPADRFTLGRGYFLTSSKNRALLEEGTAAPTDQNFEIPLQQGWNLIGDPFLFSLFWQQTMVIDPANGQAISNSSAVGKGIIANSLWAYTFGQYEVKSEMDPWRGYWVYAYQATTLIVPPSARSRAAITRSVAEPKNGQWNLSLVAQSGDLADRVYVGVSRAATEGFDTEHDLLKPPPVGDDYLYVSMPRADWGAHSGQYGVDMRPAGRSSGWDFVVETRTPNREITLRWPDIQRLPRSVNPVLVDLQTNERRYLRTTGSYTFRNTQSGVSRFRIEMASSGGLLRITNLQTSGGRSTGNNHTVAFSLTRDAQIEVNVLANGRKVRSVSTQLSRSAGVQQVNWDGRDQNGITMPPGQYLLEIKATSPDGQVARVTTPVTLTR